MSRTGSDGQGVPSSWRSAACGVPGGADLIIHDAQYSDEEYAGKIGWGHSTVEYATDVALAAEAAAWRCFITTPRMTTRLWLVWKRFAQDRAAARCPALEVFAAAEGLELHVRGSRQSVALGDVTAIRRPPVAGKRVLVVSSSETDIAAIGHLLADDNLVLLPTSGKRTALECAPTSLPTWPLSTDVFRMAWGWS